MTPFPRDVYRPLVPYVPDLRQVQVDLSDNTNLWGAHPAAVRVLQEAGTDDLARYPTGYGEDLKEVVARRFGVPVEAVATDCGSDDLLDSAFRAVCDPGERVAFPVPTFSMIPVLSRMNGLETIEHVPPPPEDRQRGPAGRTSLLPPLETVLEGEPSVVYVCSPNNPTGEVAPREWLRGLVDATRHAGGPVVVVDEAYAEFTGESLLPEAPSTPRLIVTRTLSKAYGLAGLRVGYAVGDPEVIHEIEKSRGPYKVGRLAERAAAAALADEGTWVEALAEEVAENRRRLVAELESRGLRPLPSGANFLLVPVSEDTDALPGAQEGDASVNSGPPAVRVAKKLHEWGVCVRPLPDLPGIGDGLRVTVGPWRHMERFLEALDRTLDNRPVERV